jgi:hypothetical protein
MTVYWRIFNFLARRIVALGFVFVGLIVAMANVQSALPGGTINVNGVPSDDLVFRLAAVFLPSLVSGLGVALFFVTPFKPSSESGG